MTVTAPFNFVPFSDKVFYPSWADKVSHDVPFKDGESGVIDITITAKSPTFISDGQSKKDNPGAVKKFCNHDSRYFLPATSIAGMIRNVLEIMSFSRCSQLDDSTYSFRDINNDTFRENMKAVNVKCGWLTKAGENYSIEDCGTPWRIRHEQIDKAFGLKNNEFSQLFKTGNFSNNDRCKSARYKYEQLGKACGKGSIGSLSLKHKFSYKETDVMREIAILDSSGEPGTIVFTGQPSGRKEKQGGKKASGKILEFFFRENGATPPIHQLSEIVVKNFLFAYFDGRTTQPKESTDWKFWKEKLINNGEKVPVFFQMNGKEVAHFGLSYMYKLPYKHSVHDGLPAHHRSQDTKMDLAQTILGTIAGQGLKGRVQFSHCQAESETVQPLPEVAETLGSPKASYYPIYIRQNGKTHKTYMDDTFSLAGWKRYPVHAGKQPGKTVDTGNDDIKTRFRPLPTGTVFKGKVRYHNLKKVELGALLSAIAFHGGEQCYHNIGMAKALGYGKVSLDYKASDLQCQEQEYFKAYENEMNLGLGLFWGGSEQIRELLTMASEQNNKDDSALEYMELATFAREKLNRSYLKMYSELDHIVPKFPPLHISREEYIKTKEQKKEQDNLAKDQEKQARQETLIKKQEEAKARKQQEEDEKRVQQKAAEEGRREYEERVKGLKGIEKFIAQLQSEYEDNREAVAHNAYAHLEGVGFDNLSETDKPLIPLIYEQFKGYPKVMGRRAQRDKKAAGKYQKRLNIEKLSKQQTDMTS